jgi:hypothetical protein
MLVLSSRSAIAAVAAAFALLAGTVVVASPANAVAPAAGPVLTTPTNDGDVAGNPVLSWEAVPGASLYRVVVSTSATLSPAAFTVDTANLSATPPSELANGNYFWRVTAGDAAKAFGPWSQTWTFRKGTSAAPTGLAPADGTTFAYPDETPVLQWSPMAGVKSYKLEVDDDSQFLTPVVKSSTATTVNTSYAVTANLTLDKTYYWRVWGVTAGGQETAKTDALSFMVTWPDSQPTLTAPADGATVSDVVLTWDPVPGAKEYLLEVSPNSDFTNNPTDSKTVLGTQYSPATTYANGGYFWRVSPKDTLGRIGSASVVRGFTRAPAAPSSPTNLQASTTQLSFSWSPVPNAGVYEIQFDADGNFNSGAKACTVFHARYTAYERPSGQPAPTPLYPNNPVQPAANDCSPGPGTWKWRVRALDTKPGAKDGQFGPFSATQTVTVAYPTPLAGSLAQLGSSDYLSPADCASGCTPQADTPLLKWNAVPGAQAYQVRIALDPDFTNEVQRYSVVGTELQPRESLPDNQAGTSYYWWVQPCSDLAATVCVSDDQADITATAHSFRKLADPVVLVSPAADAQVTDVVTLSWSSTYETQPEATGVGAYRVQIANDAGFTSLVETATVDQTTYQSFAKLYADSRYYWRVQAIDSSGLGLSWSTPRSFVKKSSAPVGLAATRLDASSAVPVLSWDSTSYVSGYSVQIFSGSSALFPAGSLVKEATVTLPAFTVDTALPAGTYSWRVRRIDSSTNPGAWRELTDLSALPTFTVSAPVPALLGPDEGTTITGNAVLFTWSGVVGATQYRLESSKTNGFGTLLENQVTVMTAWAPTNAYPDGVPVYWRVRALDSANNTLSMSAVRSFTKDAAGPATTIDLGTATTSLSPAIKVSFSEAATGVSATSVKLTRTGGTAVAAGLACADADASAVPCSGDEVRTVTVTPSAKVVPGETYTVAVTNGVMDAQGNPTAGATKSFRALLSVQQNAGSIVYAGSWSTVALSTASGGSYTKATSKTASATWTFKGTSVKLSYIAQKAAGKMKVYVDGVLKGTLDQYSSSPNKRTYSLVVSSGVHTVKLVPAGLKSPAATSTAVNIDALTTS